ncbi:hypothetical protein PQJ75_21815 [Rhodoplanes sp. TEM]|uniref:HNH endonuclease n=1 Tax=Rhodoplanes tepidamans TaxID=200616 RepID=A0ABT5JHE0_RHOTP|nr:MULTISPECIES: hypothetical protein [Rhodoplanes]MDC7788984.1 hypothetical protein [Rhodoplanes tepidamans]MDC7986375.1 hypothetical protein [Rhodoplanes sp. TEM]MDQ0355697.1 hypothetical protein [Rhodoplanes tepidamans]
MIRYNYDPVQVAAEIRAVDRTWFEKAQERTSTFIALGRFQERSSIWSKVKPAFMRLQHDKCVFCERQFESREFGAIEFDIEHFRPKSEVAVWPDPRRHPKLAYSFSTGDAADGYFWLAYELTNYAASCKVCNTRFKLSYFPVAGTRGRSPSSPRELAAEKPFLCYPIGDLDEDPEELITFLATTAVPARKFGPSRRRGQVIIDFFGLNEREQLHRQRARMISLFGPALQAVADGRASPKDRAVVDRMNAPDLPHAGCVRAFRRLWETDREVARRAYDLCHAFAVSDKRTPPPEI